MAMSDNPIWVVKDYKIFLREEIGRGAFGTVYKAEHNKLDKPVAAKKISPRLDRRRCIKEVCNCSQLPPLHNNVVQIFDVKQDGGDFWIFTEYCDLGDLNKYFGTHYRHVAKLGARIKIMTQIASGLKYLHDSKIVHRDIKPGNILVSSGDQEGQVIAKLGDFGLTKFLDLNDASSGMSSDVGTPFFKAPEFWEKDRTGVIRYRKSIDIFALGLTFLAMLNAQQDGSLQPVADTPKHSSEEHLSIGHIMYRRNKRLLNRLLSSKFVVVSDEEGDSKKRRALKELIRNMTHYKPADRPTIQKVLETLLKMSKVELHHKRTWKTDLINEVMCTTQDGHIVVRGKDERLNKYMLRVYDRHGNMKAEVRLKCGYWPCPITEFVHPSFTSDFQVQSVSAEGGSVIPSPEPQQSVAELDNDFEILEYRPPENFPFGIVEGCSHCKKLRLYDLNSIRVSTVYQGQDFSLAWMCKGPNHSIFGCSLKGDISYFLWDTANQRFALAAKFRLFSPISQISGMCFVPKDSSIVLTDMDNMKVVSVTLGHEVTPTSGQNVRTIWSGGGERLLVGGVEIGRWGVASTSAGNLLVGNENGQLLLLDRSNQNLQENVLDNQHFTDIWHVSYCDPYVILHHDKGISVYLSEDYM